MRYAYRGPVALLEGFFQEVERILRERGVASHANKGREPLKSSSNSRWTWSNASAELTPESLRSGSSQPIRLSTACAQLSSVRLKLAPSCYPKNLALLRLIAERHPKSVTELATLAGRAQQNVLRALHQMSAVGLSACTNAKAAPTNRS